MGDRPRQLPEPAVAVFGGVAFDGRVHEAITRYRRALAEDGDGPGPADDTRLAGTGEARLVTVRLVASDGEPRDRFLAGEPFGLEIELAGATAASTGLPHELAPTSHPDTRSI